MGFATHQTVEIRNGGNLVCIAVITTGLVNIILSNFCCIDTVY